MKLHNKKTKKYIAGIVVIFTAVLAVYLWKDLNLDGGSKIPLPDIVVENIDIIREVNGQDWRLKSPHVEHKDNVIYAKYVDIETVDKENSNIKINAEKGTFFRETDDFTLTDAHGVMLKENKKNYSLVSGKVYYLAKDETWNFSEKVTISDDVMVITGPVGIYKSKVGDMLLPNGGIISWLE